MAHGAIWHGRELDPAAKDLARKGAARPQGLGEGDDHGRIQGMGEDAGVQAGLDTPSVYQIPSCGEGMDHFMTLSVTSWVHHRDGPTGGQGGTVVCRR